MLSGRPTPLHQPNAQPAENRGAHTRGLIHGEKRRDAGAHRVAHDIGAFDLKMIEQSANIFRHGSAVIAGRVVELARRAMPAVIERDRAPTSTRERSDPAGMHPVHLLVGGEAVHQHNRLALALVEIAISTAPFRKLGMGRFNCEPVRRQLAAFARVFVSPCGGEEYARSPVRSHS